MSGDVVLIRPYLTRAQVARLLGYAPETFRKKIKALIAAGFPERHPVFKRWDPAAVAAWQNSFLGEGSKEEGAGVLPDDDALLRERALRLAHGQRI